MRWYWICVIVVACLAFTWFFTVLVMALWERRQRNKASRGKGKPATVEREWDESEVYRRLRNVLCGAKRGPRKPKRNDVSDPTRRGIVVTVEDEDDEGFAWALVALLQQQLQCQSPIELWGRRKLRTPWSETPTPENVMLRVCSDASAFLPAHALRHCDFDEALWLDVTVLPLSNPDLWFDEPLFAKSEAVLWPDLYAVDNYERNEVGLFQAFPQGVVMEKQNYIFQDDALMLVRPSSCENALELVDRLHREFRSYFHMLSPSSNVSTHQDIFQWALLATHTRYTMIQHPPSCLATDQWTTHSYVHCDTQRRPLLVHPFQPLDETVSWKGIRENESWLSPLVLSFVHTSSSLNKVNPEWNEMRLQYVQGMKQPMHIFRPPK